MKSLSNSNNNTSNSSTQNKQRSIRVKDKMHIIDKKAELLRGKAPCLSLHALLIGPEQASALGLASAAHHDANSIHRILSPIFTHRSPRNTMSTALLKTYSAEVVFDLSITSPPCLAIPSQAIARSKDSAEGTDGTINSCWKAGGPEAENSLHHLANQKLNGSNPHNKTICMWIFPHKKNLPTGPHTDNKHVGSVVANCMGPVLQSISPAQRGFVPGRQIAA